jgi:hypothetical protein
LTVVEPEQAHGTWFGKHLVPSELTGHGSGLTLINWTMVTTQLGQCPSQGCTMLLAASCSTAGTLLRNRGFVCSTAKKCTKSTVPERRLYILEKSSVYQTKGRDILSYLQEGVSLKTLILGNVKNDKCIHSPLLLGTGVFEQRIV